MRVRAFFYSSSVSFPLFKHVSCDIARFCTAPLSSEDEFQRWQREVREAEAEAEELGLKNGSLSAVDDQARPSTPPEGEEEFTDDDGTTYKWDRGLRAWVPQVSLAFVFFSSLNLVAFMLYVTKIRFYKAQA